MRFIDRAIQTAGDILHPSNYSRIMGEGLGEIERPLRNILSGESFKSMGNIGKDLLDLPINTVMGGAFLYPALKSRPDLDDSGPMEDASRRGFHLYSAAASMSPNILKRGIGAGLAGLIGADLAGSTAFKHLGRLFDKVTGMRPDPQELQERFIGRLSPRATELKNTQPGMSEEQSFQEALKEVLQEDPDYISRMNIG